MRLASGREVIFDYLTSGDLFGEKHLLTPQPRGQIATALSPVRVLTFRKSELPALVRRDSRLAQQMLKNLALRLDRYEETIRNFVTEPAERRLARLLGRLMPTRTRADWTPLRLSPSNSELAKTVGTTRSRIATFMRHFSSWAGSAADPSSGSDRKVSEPFSNRPQAALDQTGRKFAALLAS